MLEVIFIILAIFIYLILRYKIMPTISKVSFPLEKICEYFGVEASEVTFFALEYSKTPLYHKKYLKNHFRLIPWIPDITSPYYIYFYKIQLGTNEYWLVYRKRQTIFGLSKNRKYLLYSDSLEFLAQLPNS